MDKMAAMDLPDHVYNWLIDFFKCHSHCVKYSGETSTQRQITASIIQGSAVGPAAYVAYAADLHPVSIGNDIVKYADDTYLVIPASNAGTREAEISNIESWALTNNLQLNRTKSTEIVFRDKRRRLFTSEPKALDAIKRVSVIKILGVTFTNSLSVSEHVNGVIQSCARNMYALRVLRSHGCPGNDLQHVFRSTVVAKLVYAASAWVGLATARDLQRINAFLHRCIRSGMCSVDLPAFERLCASSDSRLFNCVASRSDHVLHYLLPQQSIAFYNYFLRQRNHSRELPANNTKLLTSNFLQRVLYNIY
jgi:hypothetical protein